MRKENRSICAVLLSTVLTMLLCLSGCGANLLSTAAY